MENFVGGRELMQFSGFTFSSDPLNDQRALIDNIMSGNVEVIIYGARALGEALAKYFMSKKVKICCFCDKNLNFQRDGLLNLPVVSVEKAVGLGYPIIICATRYLDEMANYLKELNFKPFLPFYYFFNNEMINFSDRQENIWLYEQVNILLNRKKLLNEKKDPFIMDNLPIIITERCTLKCKECLSEIPYLDNPKDENLENQFKALERLFLAVDYIDTITITGGEALLHPGLTEFINRLIISYGNRFSFIHLITNGTIIPPESFMNSFARSPNIILNISDYGVVSKHKEEIIRMAGEYGLLYYVIDYSRIFWNSRPEYFFEEVVVNSPESLKKTYEACEMHCSLLKQGNYYNCALTPVALRKKGIPSLVDDSINLLDEKLSDLEMKKKLREYISQRYTKTCGCCPKIYYSKADRVPAGIQL